MHTLTCAAVEEACIRLRMRQKRRHAFAYVCGSRGGLHTLTYAAVEEACIRLRVRQKRRHTYAYVCGSRGGIHTPTCAAVEEACIRVHKGNRASGVCAPAALPLVYQKVHFAASREHACGHTDVACA
jgi:hypothetical protein